MTISTRTRTAAARFARAATAVATLGVAWLAAGAPVYHW